MGDDARHLRPGEEALAAQHLGGVLDDQQRRRLAGARHRHPDQRPLALAALAARQAHGRARQLAADAARRKAATGASRAAPRHRRRQALPHLASPSSSAATRLCISTRPSRVERDHAGGDVLDHPLDHLLLAQQPLARLGDAPRHLVDRLDQRRQLQLGGRQVERRRAGGDPPGALDQLDERPGEVAGQAGAHGDQQGEEGGASPARRGGAGAPSSRAASSCCARSGIERNSRACAAGTPGTRSGA